MTRIKQTPATGKTKQSKKHDDVEEGTQQGSAGDVSHLSSYEDQGETKSDPQPRPAKHARHDPRPVTPQAGPQNALVRRKARSHDTLLPSSDDADSDPSHCTRRGKTGRTRTQMQRHVGDEERDRRGNDVGSYSDEPRNNVHADASPAVTDAVVDLASVMANSTNGAFSVYIGQPQGLFSSLGSMLGLGGSAQNISISGFGIGSDRGISDSTGKRKHRDYDDSDDGHKSERGRTRVGSKRRMKGRGDSTAKYKGTEERYGHRGHDDSGDVDGEGDDEQLQDSALD